MISVQVIINRKKGFFYLCIYFILIFSGYNRYDEVGVFTSDSFRFVFKPIKLNDYAKSILKKDFPFVKQKLNFAFQNQLCTIRSDQISQKSLISNVDQIFRKLVFVTKRA